MKSEFLGEKKKKTVIYKKKEKELTICLSTIL